jgi:xanthine dehydrogenase accessory factor
MPSLLHYGNIMKTGAADHHRIIAASQAWRGAAMAIATVIETWRSAPCPSGTHMLIHDDGRFVGSVSGGCVEGDVLHKAREIIGGAPFAVRRYGVGDGAAWEVGLPCGGDIVVLIQPLSAHGFNPNLLPRILEAHRRGETALIGTNLQTGFSNILSDDEGADFINIYPPPRRLLIVGAVEIASALSVVAASIGVDVTVIDPRAQFLTTERFPGVTLDDRWPDEAIVALKPDRRTAVITLSHDPKIDDPALISALGSTAGYVAALGSKASQAARFARLKAVGVSDAALSRIEGPAGVTINAISAPEIALSIAGGMIRAFNDGLR